MRYKMIFSYDGSNYFGYQKQVSEKTIQSEIEACLRKIFQQEITIYASGRTDKGVHAINQVAIFDIDKSLDVDKTRYSLNKMLSEDIHIKSLNRCKDDFHARFSAIKKEYIYLLSIEENNPLKNRYIYYSTKDYDFKLIKKAMKLFLGKHDFKNFCTNKEELSYEEEIFSFNLTKVKDHYCFSIIGSGFKRYMVRMIIGTLLEIGLHKLTLDDLKKLLDSENRNIVSYKAPAQALYLKEVFYKKEDEVC